MHKVHHILFDLDGTLVDSSGAIQASLAHALQSLGRGLPPDCAVESLIGTPLVDIFRDRFGITGAPAEQAIAQYRDHYDRHAHMGTKVYARIAETLDRLCTAGIGLYVATVKPSPVAEKVLRDMGLNRFFSGVAGSSMDHARRDKGDIIRYALQQHDLEARHSGATEVSTKLSANSKQLKLIITDNGHGLNGEVPASLKRRARLLGGQVVSEKAEPEGTRIILKLNIRRWRILKI